MNGRFVDKVAVVTGGATGIGLATARAFAAEGAKVVLSSRTVKTGEAAAAEIVAAGHTAHFVATDVSDSAAVENLMARTEKLYGGIDILFANAGVPARGSEGGVVLGEVEEAIFDEAFAINVRGIWLCLKHAVPAMRRRGGGVIVNMSSTMGLVGQAKNGVYSATKHAVMGLTKSAALEYGGENIRVNAVCPGAIETAFVAPFKVGYSEAEWAARIREKYPAAHRVGRPEEVADVVLWLASDESSFVHGVGVPIDGGYIVQ
ncbi:MAG: glucose 1-dehydrogenase [Proteobacteria bacterium]|nr:glucose 1-dehydrogenase [Pseudomonadota bacterium]